MLRKYARSSDLWDSHKMKISISDDGSEHIVRVPHTEYMDSLGRDRILSRRQKEVLALLVTGRSDKEIADVLNISIHTAKFHVRVLFAAFKVHSRYRLISLAVRNEARKQK